MGEKLISIIVPVYNAEKTIERCINSLCTMLETVEIICIDDGSKDRSGELLDKLSEGLPNIITVHQKNKGAAAARNKGLSIASGEYIMFCDADDEYHKDTLSYIMEDIINEDPDYVVFCREQHMLGGGVLRHAVGDSKSRLYCSWDEYFNNILLEHGHGVVVFNKVYRRALIVRHNVRFDDELHFGEDSWFNLNYIPHAKSFIEDFRAIYIQHSTEGSLCSSRNDNFYNLCMQGMNKYRLLYPERSSKINVCFHKFFFVTGIIAIRRNLRIKNEYDKTDRAKLFSPILLDHNFQESLQYVSSMHTVKNTEGMKKEANWLLKGGLFGFSLRYYYYPKVKQFVKKIIDKK